MRDNNGSVVRAIRGPIILITIGALFALNNFSIYRFDQTWPVLLIVIGLLSLLKRGVEPPRAAPPPPAPPGYQPTSYAQSPYSQPPVGAPPTAGPGATAGPSKGGFGSSAPPRSGDAPPSAPSTPEGGSV